MSCVIEPVTLGKGEIKMAGYLLVPFAHAFL